jgi:hypothetical protein
MGVWLLALGPSPAIYISPQAPGCTVVGDGWLAAGSPESKDKRAAFFSHFQWFAMNLSGLVSPLVKRESLNISGTAKPTAQEQ